MKVVATHATEDCLWRSLLTDKVGGGEERLCECEGCVGRKDYS